MSLASLFEYDRHAALNVREVDSREDEGHTRQLMVTSSPSGVRRIAEFFLPEGDGPFPAMLYVHWYEPESPDSNRTQFVEEAAMLAQRGAASLLIETMWSDRDWFLKRTQQEDYDNSIRQVIELRQALDLLVDHPRIDPYRVAYVGHDFGGMYGVLMGRVDMRPHCYVIMAATPRFPEWYLYYPKLEGEARDNYISMMAEFDPINHVAALSPHPLLFQFANDDFHVPHERAEAFFKAAGDPKTLKWYEAGHGLNDEATTDRIAWLAEQLGLD